MKFAIQIFSICGLLCGISCQNWAAFMPQTVTALCGSCVTIPCTFSMAPDWNQHLDGSCKAIWYKGRSPQVKVFDSSKNTSSNVLQGNLKGILRHKNCTTIFNNLSSKDEGSYCFRLQCKNVQYTFAESAVIKVTDSLPPPTVTPSCLGVKEGTQVSLKCSALAPCSLLPPALEWTPSFGNIKVSMEAEYMTSVMTFTASSLHHGQEFLCSPRYTREDGSSILLRGNSLTPRVLYPPRNTSISADFAGPVMAGNTVILTCDTEANPPVTSYSWYKVGGVQAAALGSKKHLSTTISDVDHQFYCVVSNKYGSQNSTVMQIDMQYPPRNTSISADFAGPVMAGNTVILTCDTEANPPVTSYSWYKAAGREKEMLSSERDFIFSVTKLSDDQYYCEARNVHGAEHSEPITLDVTFVPEILPSSNCVENVSLLQCSCDSQGNPPPSLLWELDEKPVNHSAEISIGEVSLGSFGMRSLITLHQLNEDMSSLVCLSINPLGSDRFVFNVSLSETQPGFHAVSVLIGSTVGALGMMLVCVLLLLFFWRKRRDISSDEANCVFVSHINNAMLEGEGITLEEIVL